MVRGVNHHLSSHPLPPSPKQKKNDGAVRSHPWLVLELLHTPIPSTIPFSFADGCERTTQDADHPLLHIQPEVTSDLSRHRQPPPPPNISRTKNRRRRTPERRTTTARLRSRVPGVIGQTGAVVVCNSSHACAFVHQAKSYRMDVWLLTNHVSSIARTHARTLSASPTNSRCIRTPRRSGWRDEWSWFAPRSTHGRLASSV